MRGCVGDGSGRLVGWAGDRAYSWQCQVTCAACLPYASQWLHLGWLALHVLQGRQSYMDKRAPDFSRFKRLP